MVMHFASTLAWAYPVDEVVQLAKQSELSGLEIWAEQVWFHGTNPEKIRKANRDQSINLTMHAASWDLNICSIEKEIRESSVRQIQHSIKLADEIGADSITFHPGRLTLPQMKQEIYETLMMESIFTLIETAKQYKKTLSIELMEVKAKEFVTSPDTMNRLIASFIPELKTTFDVAHISEGAPERAFADLINVDKIHVSDNTESQLHVPLGTGILDRNMLREFFAITSLPVVVEGFDASENLNWWKHNLHYLKSLAMQKEVPQ
ncbi:sugar phosphate isomerase/epimerase family protein [Niallia sp. FSL W8-0635]|uniref:sugar phosphate isomerase/epimerase family protein n=1 Tax=Niallia sp. FSL W8-0635 TaxID=2975337 RepID=UPI002B03F1FB|nr:sugar phosphate isomerase/epimerase [Yersinia enterocolitica]